MTSTLQAVFIKLDSMDVSEHPNKIANWMSPQI